MNVLEIPFNSYLGVQTATEDNSYIYKISERPELLNHLGTIHASVLFALSEATSGQFLLDQFHDVDMDFIPVVRKSEVKFSKPVNGTVYSKATVLGFDKRAIIEELESKNRTIIKVKVNLLKNNEIVMTAFFDWFVAINK